MNIRQLYRSGARLGLGCSAFLLLSMSLAYVFQPEALAALTSLPPWAWLLPGILSVVLSLGGDAKRTAAGLLIGWILFGAVFVDEVRGSWRLPKQEARAIRLISLNCGALRKVAAVSEVLPYEPDIVLLQESPPEAEVSALSRRLFGKAGAYAWDIDASILVHGEILRTSREPESRLIQARVRLPQPLLAHGVPDRLLVGGVSPNAYGEAAAPSGPGAEDPAAAGRRTPGRCGALGRGFQRRALERGPAAVAPAAARRLSGGGGRAWGTPSPTTCLSRA